MNNNENMELKIEFYALIEKVSKSKDSELCADLKKMNKYLEKYDNRLVNLGQNFIRVISTNIKEKMKKYVNDIIDRFDKYSIDDKKKVREFLIEITNKYGDERKLIDKILSVLGFS